MNSNNPAYAVSIRGLVPADVIQKLSTALAEAVRQAKAHRVAAGRESHQQSELADEHQHSTT